MQKDYLRELGFLALASRMKRVSDEMIHSGRDMYKSLEVDIEPNWYMIFLLLKEEKELSVMEIAKRLRLSHPSIIAIIEKMAKKGYLKSRKCDMDGRSQKWSLTARSIKALPDFERIWESGTLGLEFLMGKTDLLDLLNQLEDGLENNSFKERTLERLESAYTNE